MPAKAKTSKGPKRTMSAQHKAALAAGRTQGRSVANYLDALEAHRPKRGRKRTIETVRRQLNETIQALKTTGGSARLALIQRRRDLENELDTMQSGGSDLPALERDFVKVAKGYAESKGISYAAWREFGVSAETLAKAGITRGS